MAEDQKKDRLSMIRMRKKKGYKYEDTWVGARMVRKRVKDFKAIARWRGSRERLFGRLYGEEVAQWCADNNIAFYSYGIRDILRDRAKKIRFMIKNYKMTRGEVIEYLNEQLVEYNLRVYSESIPELKGLDFNLWPREEQEYFNSNWKFKIYGTP